MNECSVETKKENLTSMPIACLWLGTLTVCSIWKEEMHIRSILVHQWAEMAWHSYTSPPPLLQAHSIVSDHQGVPDQLSLAVLADRIVTYRKLLSSESIQFIFLSKFLSDILEFALEKDLQGRTWPMFKTLSAHNQSYITKKQPEKR